MNNQNIFNSIKIFFLIFSSAIHSSPIVNNASSVPLVLLISFDGFRWDYPDLYQLPHFNALIERGVHVKHIENSFATVTFPSHYTMITGLYEETHGIVANAMYDPELNASATINTMNDTKWWSQNAYSQPIWVSNQLSKDSNQRRSGVIAWPGVNTPINGYLPSKYQTFNLTRPFASIAQQVLDWFREPIDTRINLGVIYYPEPDITGHEHGPISSQMNETLRKCDQYLGELLQKIDDDEYLRMNLNVIITSDHGMEEVKKNHTIQLEKYLDTSLFSAYGGRAFVNIFVHSKSDIDRIYANLSRIPNYEVYKKSQIPAEYHYQSNVRIGDIVFVGKAGYDIVVPGDNGSIELTGDHGYDNQIESMHPIFYAFGPAFRRQIYAEPFRSVDIYPLMSHILGLEERKTNGSLDNVKAILQEYSEKPFLSHISSLFFETTSEVSGWGLITVGCLCLVILMGVCYGIVACRHSRQLIYVETHHEPIRYRLLSHTEGSTNNLVVSDSEDEVEIR